MLYSYAAILFLDWEFTWQNKEENFLFLALPWPCCSMLLTPILSPKPESETPEDVAHGERLVSEKDCNVTSLSCNFASKTYMRILKAYHMQ